MGGQGRDKGLDGEGAPWGHSQVEWILRSCVLVVG